MQRTLRLRHSAQLFVPRRSLFRGWKSIGEVDGTSAMIPAYRDLMRFRAISSEFMRIHASEAGHCGEVTACDHTDGQDRNPESLA